MAKITDLKVAYFPNSNSVTRSKNDFYPTPPIATLTLLKNYVVPHKLWEPCAGRGHISKELIRNGHEVISTDLYAYPDTLVPVETGFDALTSKFDVDGVITNPPFKNNFPQKLIEHTLIDNKYLFLAMFCRLTFMESARRYKLFKEHPPTEILVFSDRVHVSEQYVDKNNGIGGMVAYAWFIWDKKVDYSNRIKWVRPSSYVKELA